MISKTIGFLRRQWRAKAAIVRTARVVRERTGKPVAPQLLEIARLRFGPGKLYAPDYFTYGVYDDDRYSRAEKKQVLSWHPARLADALNDPGWRAVCDDKLVYYALLRGLGAPFPAIRAAFDPRGRTFGEVPVLTTIPEVVHFLRSGMRYPFFGKRVAGGYGTGASSVTSLDAAADRLRLGTGESMTVPDYVERYVAPARQGYLFQESVRQAPSIDRITGGRVGTLRMIVLRGDDGPRLFRVVWRIPVGRNITDNFLHGTQGNLIAQVDRATGTVGTAIQVMPLDPETPGRALRLGHEITAHPDTGEHLDGLVLPDWDRLVTTCLHAAAALPGLRYQSWDVAMGADGAQLLELNYRGDFGLAQIPRTRGLYDDEFRTFWARYARDR